MWSSPMKHHRQLEGIHADALTESLNILVGDLDDAHMKLDAALEENASLKAELVGVMHFVDKWFDENDPRLEENKNNPTQRAADAREIALRAIEGESNAS